LSLSIEYFRIINLEKVAYVIKNSMVKLMSAGWFGVVRRRRHGADSKIRIGPPASTEWRQAESLGRPAGRSPWSFPYHGRLGPLIVSG
jgi:hypothetical protein